MLSSYMIYTKTDSMPCEGFGRLGGQPFDLHHCHTRRHRVIFVLMDGTARVRDIQYL
jgi:hypothetical protein